MSINLAFTKMVAGGYGYLVIEYSEYKKSRLFTSELARKLCDGVQGIGADGLIIVERQEEESIDYSALVYNSDGTVADLNFAAVLCFSKYLLDNEIVKNTNFNVVLNSKSIPVQQMPNSEIRIELPSPNLPDIYTLFNEDLGVQNVSQLFLKEGYKVVFLNVDKVEDMDSDSEEEKLPVQILSSKEIELRLEKRDNCSVNYFKAAMMVAACAILNNLTQNEVEVILPYGTVIVEWHGVDDGSVSPLYLTSLSKCSFVGDFIL